MSFPSVDAALTGLTVVDALDVPVEFLERAPLRQDPVTGMRGYGSHHQPATGSRDTNQWLCAAHPGGRYLVPADNRPFFAIGAVFYKLHK